MNFPPLFCRHARSCKKEHSGTHLFILMYYTPCVSKGRVSMLLFHHRAGERTRSSKFWKKVNISRSAIIIFIQLNIQFKKIHVNEGKWFSLELISRIDVLWYFQSPKVNNLSLVFIMTFLNTLFQTWNQVHMYVCLVKVVVWV